MKTIVLEGDVVINVCVGEPTSDAPIGQEHIVVEDNFWVGVGCIRQSDGTYVMPDVSK